MKMKCLVFLTMALGAGSVLAQDSLQDYVTSACRSEITNFCDTVTPGEGRLLYCAAAHADKLSDECAGALMNASMILADITDQVLITADACAVELETHCADVEMGEGRILQCLDDHDDELGMACDKALEDLLDE